MKAESCKMTEEENHEKNSGNNREISQFSRTFLRILSLASQNRSESTV